MFRQWKPEFQQRAMSMLAEFEGADWHPFFCPVHDCDGRPHTDGSWDWPHARVDQRPPPMNSTEWFTLLFSGGRGAGKSRTGSEITHRMSRAGAPAVPGRSHRARPARNHDRGCIRHPGHVSSR